jgi:hypothetical protein
MLRAGPGMLLGATLAGAGARNAVPTREGPALVFTAGESD